MHEISAPRYPEIDVLRTIAILGMIIYHTAYDLAELYGWDFDPLSGGWWIFARITAVLFLLVSGASNTIANARAQHLGGMQATWKRTTKRSLQIAVAAFLVTLVTYFFDPGSYIRFGILHCIALSVFLLPVFQPLRQWNLLLGMTIILVGNFLIGTTTDTALFLPFGILPPDFFSLDYFPMFPWFGVVLLGSAIADVVYLQHQFSGLHFSLMPVVSSVEGLSAFCSSISRWSLLIYLAHQPVILSILVLVYKN